MAVTTLNAVAIAPTDTNGSANAVTVAARHMYDAEFALHAADESHVDAWIMAASNKLHAAIAEHTAACAGSYATYAA